MTDIMEMDVEGVQELQRKMEQVAGDIHGMPMLNAMRDATLKVQRDAKIFAPIDTGRLRASIMPEVRATTETVEGVVGSNVTYAPYMEFGTGMFSDKAMMGAGGRHWPPSNALADWARRHGIPSGFLVARAIGIRGGLKPRHYLKKALERNQDYIKRQMENVVARIVRK